MRKAVLGLAFCGLAVYVAALLLMLAISRRPAFERVVAKPASSVIFPEEPTRVQVNQDLAAGLEVIGSDGKIAGRLSGVTHGPNGKTKSILLETGGFLGLGSRVVRMPARAFRIEDGALHLDRTGRELELLPESSHAR